MSRFQAGEIHFNLMALVEDRLQRLRRRGAHAREAGDEAAAAAAADEAAREEERRAVWARDNVRRKHNYLPFIVELLKGLARVSRTICTQARVRHKFTSQAKFTLLIYGIYFYFFAFSRFLCTNLRLIFLFLQEGKLRTVYDAAKEKAVEREAQKEKKKMEEGQQKA